jgi:uncharacterized protein
MSIRRFFILLALMTATSGPAWSQSAPLFGDDAATSAPLDLEEYKNLPMGLLLIKGDGPQVENEWGLAADEQAKPCAIDDCLLFVSRGEYRKAFAGLIEAVKKGNPVAHETLGLMYKNGNGVERNHKKAFDLLLVAAEKGEIASQYNIGSMYFLGEGTDINRAQGLVWLEIASARAEDATLRQRIRKDRDAVAESLTRHERDTAKERAQKWLDDNGEGHLINRK